GVFAGHRPSVNCTAGSACDYLGPPYRGKYTLGMIKQLTTNTAAGLRRVSMLAAITIGAWLMAWLLTLLGGGPATRANDFFYDVFYGTRAQADMTGANGDVVLVVADQDS